MTKYRCHTCGVVYDAGDSLQREEIWEAVHFEKTGHSMFTKVKIEE
jgi:rubredoxin